MTTAVIITVRRPILTTVPDHLRETQIEKKVFNLDILCVNGHQYSQEKFPDLRSSNLEFINTQEKKFADIFKVDFN